MKILMCFCNVCHSVSTLSLFIIILFYFIFFIFIYLFVYLLGGVGRGGVGVTFVGQQKQLLIFYNYYSREAPWSSGYNLVMVYKVVGRP